MQNTKRHFIAKMALLPFMASCQSDLGGAISRTPEAQRRLRGIPLIEFVDIVRDVKIFDGEFYADGDIRPFHGRSVFFQDGEIGSYPSATVPIKVRFIWRKQHQYFPISWGAARNYDDNGKPIQDKYYVPQGRMEPEKEIERRKLIMKNKGLVHAGPWGSEFTGELAGDHTFEVASRIPDDVIGSIRSQGGGLRLKYRLTPEGVLFGWDIERSGGTMSKFFMPGGDFKEAYFENGVVIQKGWYIDKNGQKILTDW